MRFKTTLKVKNVMIYVRYDNTGNFVHRSEYDCKDAEAEICFDSPIGGGLTDIPLVKSPFTGKYLIEYLIEEQGELT